MTNNLKEEIRKVILKIDVYDDTSIDEDEAEKAVKKIDKLVSALINQKEKEGVIKELEKAVHYAKNIPDVGIRYPEDKEKYREFARASVVMTNYASTRIKQLKEEREQL